jgi:hypothetical protein
MSKICEQSYQKMSQNGRMHAVAVVFLKLMWGQGAADR